MSQDYRYKVALGDVTDAKTVNVWGYNPDIDIASGQEFIARYSGNLNIITTADNLSIVSDSANDTIAGSGARLLWIQGIGEDFLYQEEYLALNGLTPVTSAKKYLGVNFIVVVSAGNVTGNLGNITVQDLAGTVGTQAYISVGVNTTQLSSYHTRIGYTFLADWLWLNVRKLAGGTNPRVTVRAYSYSRVTNIKYQVFRHDIDTSIESTFELKPSQPFIIGGREIFYLTAETDTNNTIVNVRYSGIEIKNS